MSLPTCHWLSKWAVIVLATVAAGAAQSTTLSFNPAAPGHVDCGADSLVVTVDVDQVVNLRGFTLNVTYDSTRLVVSSVSAGSAITVNDGDHPLFFNWYDWPESDGTIRVDAALLGWSLNLTGPGALVRICFTAGATKGEGPLGFGTVTLRDPANIPIPASVVAGVLENWCNAAPVANDAVFTLAENSLAGTAVGTVTATDPGDALTFAITAGNDGGAFVINPASGAITVADAAPLDFEATPTFNLTVTVTDNDIHQPRSDTAAITVNLTNVNEAPVLGLIGDKTVDEMTLLTFTATASDADGPTTTFSLDGASVAAGMAIDGTSGVFTWTPSETQGPGAYTVVVTVSDGTLPDTETITITVNEANLAPVLGAIGDRTVDELVLLTFSVAATDPDLPAQGLAFSLDPASVLSGMAIDGTSGVFTWTPSETQGPGAYTVVVTVSDGTLPDTETITITVNEVNAAPVVSGIPDQTVAEGTAFAPIILDNFVDDPDHADALLSWVATGQTALTVLIEGRVATITAPANWSGYEDITFTATDQGTPPLADADEAKFTVTGVNDPPVVTTPAAQNSTVQDGISLTVSATDPENDTLTWTATGLPSGLAMAPTTGLISGTIACGAETSSPYAVAVTVTDNGVPAEATTVTFAWTVVPLSAPVALTALTATQMLTGNDADGTTKIALAWPDLPAGLTAKVYRKGFGNYPEYDDPPGAGAVPVVPGTQALAIADGWELAVLVGGADGPARRDFWYYVAFVENACGASSGPSPMTAGTLNYHLGDVMPLGAAPPYGDNHVTSADVSALGDAYRRQDGHPRYRNYLDVGPTTTYAVSGRPTTDNVIEFEDLILFAINFVGGVGKTAGPAPAERNLLTVVVPPEPVGDRLEVALWLAADGAIRGASIPLTWDPRVVEPIAVAAGELAGRQAGTTLVLESQPGTVDVGLFGASEDGLSGTGCLATVTFAVLGTGDPRLGVGDIRARDAHNQPCDLAAEVALESPLPSGDIPATSVLHAAYPNPFNPSATLKYGLAREGRVSLRIYDLSGRVVATLVDESRPAGTHEVVWDGTDTTGRVVASGTYVARLITADATQARRLTLVK